MLGEQVVHGLAHGNQRQDLTKRKEFINKTEYSNLPLCLDLERHKVFMSSPSTGDCSSFSPWPGRWWRPRWTWVSRGGPDTGPGWRWRGGCVSGGRVAGRSGPAGAWPASGPAADGPLTETDRRVQSLDTVQPETENYWCSVHRNANCFFVHGCFDNKRKMQVEWELRVSLTLIC